MEVGDDGWNSIVEGPDPEQLFLSEALRLLDRYELQADLVETLKQTPDHSHLVPKIAGCHRSFRHKRCDRNHNWAEAQDSCSLRICPHCSYRRSKILAQRIQSFLQGKKDLRYVVLAERNSSDATQGLESLWSSWGRIRRFVGWKRRVKGCIAAAEITYNAEENTFHPHLNVLFEGDYIPFEALRQMWVKATYGQGQTAFIRAADHGTVFELIKYVTKLVDLLGHPEAMNGFLSAIKGVRLIRTYGTFRNIPVEDEGNEQNVCPDCPPDYHPLVVDLGEVSANSVWLDHRGNFRVRRAREDCDCAERRALDFTPGMLPPGRKRPISALLRHWDKLHAEVKKKVRIA